MGLGGFTGVGEYYRLYKKYCIILFVAPVTSRGTSREGCGIVGNIDVYRVHRIKKIDSWVYNIYFDTF